MGQTIEQLQNRANCGDPNAQFELALNYETGQGVEQDWKQAFFWYKQATEQGNMYAQYNLGLCYANEKGVPQDLQKAEFWCRKSAQNGNKFAAQWLEEQHLL